MSGCGLSPLPDEERYQYIYKVLDAVEYKTAGTIVTKVQDSGDGVFAPSYVEVTYEESSAHQNIENRLKELGADCAGLGSNDQVSCNYNGTTVDLSSHQAEQTSVFLRVIDSSNGR